MKHADVFCGLYIMTHIIAPFPSAPAADWSATKSGVMAQPGMVIEILDSPLRCWLSKSHSLKDRIVPQDSCW